MKPGERGAALLSVLLLVAVMAVLAAASLEKLRLGTRLASNAAAIDQARTYAYAAESLARYRIGDLILNDPAKTTLQGDWEGRDVAFPIDGGIATARLQDGGNCFNLNSLVEGSDERGFVPRSQAIEQFVRLLDLLDVRPDEARSVALSATDWIDSDTAPQSGGAEDDIYARAPTPYRAANTLMVDPSEFRAVAGVTPALYSRARPFLCALPVADLSAINLNTLSRDRAPLLAMLVPGLDAERAARLIDARPINGWGDLAAIRALPGMAAIDDGALTQMRFITRWFGLRLNIELAGAELQENALIDAGTRPAKLVRRSYGDPA